MPRTNTGGSAFKWVYGHLFKGTLWKGLVLKAKPEVNLRLDLHHPCKVPMQTDRGWPVWHGLLSSLKGYPGVASVCVHT